MSNTPLKFELNLSKIERLTQSIWSILYDLSKLGITTLYSNKSGLIQTCNYSIQDAQAAIDSYKVLSFEEFKRNRYLVLYGLFQSFFVQQDALKTLFRHCLNYEIKFDKEYPELYNIREVRNNTIGHPTDRKKEYFFISQLTLKKKGFYLVAHDNQDKNEAFLLKYFLNLYMIKRNPLLSC